MLLAGQQNGRCRYRAFIKVATSMQRKAEGPGHSAEQVRGWVRRDLTLLADLKPAGAIRLDKPTGRGEIRHVTLLKNGVRRWWWSGLVRELLWSWEIEDVSMSLRAVAEFLELHERTLWRWRGGHSVPSASDMRRLLWYLGFFPDANADRRQSNLFSMEMELRGFTDRERERALAFLNRELWQPIYQWRPPEDWLTDPAKMSPELRHLRRTAARAIAPEPLSIKGGPGAYMEFFDDTGRRVAPPPWLRPFIPEEDPE